MSHIRPWWIALLAPIWGWSQELAGKTVVLPISDEGEYMVDQVQAEWVEEMLDRAEAEGAARVVLEIDTFGGVVFSARSINERLLRMEIPTLAYVKTKAISAGAFIAFACDEIHMGPATTIGDAQMVVQTMEGGIEVAPEKFLTVYRSDWKKACDANGHPFPVALAFFDAETELLECQGDPRFMTRRDYDRLEEDERPPIVRVVSEPGELLTLHSGEMEEMGLASVHDSLDGLMAALGVSDPVRLQMDTNQKVLRFLGLNQWLFFILLIVGLNGLYMEIKTPGFGVSGLTAMVCFAIVFGSRYMLGTAEPYEIAIFCLGILLAIVEIFVLPGFGVAGVLGILLTLGALLLASLPEFRFLPEEFAWDWARDTAVWIMSAFVASLGSFALLAPAILSLPFVQRRMLATELTVEAGYVVDTVPEHEAIIGVRGRSVGVLRPSGRIELDDGRLVDVVSGDGYIDRGTLVEVVELDGNRVIVRRVEG